MAKVDIYIKCSKCGIPKDNPCVTSDGCYGAGEAHRWDDGTTSDGARWRCEKFGCPKEVRPGPVPQSYCSIHFIPSEPINGPTRVYVAAPYSLAQLVRGIHVLLRGVGIQCTSSWADEATSANETTDPKVLAKVIEDNDRGVEQADIILALGVEGKGRAMFGEIRYAQTLGKPVHYAGPVYLDVHRPGTVIHPDSLSATCEVARLARSASAGT